MGTIHVDRFLGIAPKVAATLLDATQAQAARNAKLWAQVLRPVDGLLVIAKLDKDAGEIQAIWRYNDSTDWLAWLQDADVVRTAVAGDTLEKVAYAYAGVAPRITSKDLYDDGTPGVHVPPANYILGLPTPTAKPVSTDTGAGNITATSTWVMTFVRQWSDGTVDESAPSPPSVVRVSAGRQVSVTLPDGAMATPTDYGITHKRLYRSDGGHFFFVVEETFATASTTDNNATADLGEAVATQGDSPPPTGLQGLVELANGVVAGFKGNTVYLSEPYRPHAYPVLNRYAMSWPVVALGGYGTTLIVATEAYPYIGRGLDPRAYSFKPQVGDKYPCVSKRSMASGKYGVFWATHDGIAMANESGVTLATREFLGADEWKVYKPETMHGIVHNDRYYAWYSTGVDDAGRKVGGGVVLDRGERAFLTELGRYVEAAYSDPSDGKLYVATPATDGSNYIFAFDELEALPEQYYWKSKVFVTPGLDNLGWGQIVAEYGETIDAETAAAIDAEIAFVVAYNTTAVSNGAMNELTLNGSILNGDTQLLTPPSTDFVAANITFQYWADGVLRLSRVINSKEPFPLPSGFRAERHEFALSGEVEVTQVTLASTVEELASA